MQLSYEYAIPSACLYNGDQITLGLSPDLLRDEKVSFVGKLKHPLIFRDSMLLLRKIIISDMRKKKKNYREFLDWLNQELENRMIDHKEYLKGYEQDLKNKMRNLENDLSEIDKKINENLTNIKKIKNFIDNCGMWDNYNRIERSFWNYISSRDRSLWVVLDPVITVHPDQVSFEAFSLDESIYGCLSISKEEFDITGTPQLGTTNIDFSTKLAKEIERFRTYNEVELSINPEGLIVDSGVTPEHLEKKVSLPETWIKGFTQVSAAASLKGIDFDITPVDMYDICSFLRRNKEHKSPRSMKWILVPNQRIKIIFEPWNKEITLSTIYNGKKSRTERIWGRRRWLILEKIIPIVDNFKIKLLGFGMPQFIIAEIGMMKLTFGFTAWSANDWVKGTAFNILAGFIGEDNQDLYKLLKSNRVMTFEDIKKILKKNSDKEYQASIGSILRRGEAYFDPIINALRFRQLLNVPIPNTIYEITQLEKDVMDIVKSSQSHYKLSVNEKAELIAEDFHNIQVRKKKRSHLQRNFRLGYRYEPEYSIETQTMRTTITFDQDGQISKLSCDCKEFKKGPRNISSPCSHILALYIKFIKF